LDGGIGDAIMRVIRTEVYPEREVRVTVGIGNTEPGVTFCWFQGDVDQKLLEHSGWMHWHDFDRREIRGLLDIFARNASLSDSFDGGPEYRFKRDHPVYNPDVVTELLDESVVMEKSPPYSIAFGEILKSINAKYLLGTYVGMLAGGPHDSIILLLTVPGGILAVSSAIGMARAIERGLQVRMKEIFKR
jgi:hypothetical protein